MDLIAANICVSDDEEDLEALRLAALQSLKTPVTEVALHQFPANLQISGKRPRNFHGGQIGRSQRNGHFNNRTRNTNLISIPMVGQEHLKKEETPKLILPQDRYCSLKSNSNVKRGDCVSKFDRYDNSDKSESESEDECLSEMSDTNSPSKLERSSSLEALMQELDNEINGVSKNEAAKNKPKIKKVKKVENDEPKPLQEVEVKKSEEVEKKIERKQDVPKREQLNERRFQKRFMKRSRQLPYVNPNVPFVPQPTYSPILPSSQGMLYPPNVPYEPQLAYNHLMMPVNMNNTQSPEVYSPNRYNRCSSPLTLNTDVLNTITKAPLSPRSAAFVLKNREIIEMRKKSPRRSFSRSPSPRYRRSKSPRYRRSLSPSPRRSISPRCRTPKRRSTPETKYRSPKRNPSPAPTSPKRFRGIPSPKTAVHNRLGARNKNEEEKKIRKRSLSLSLSPSPSRVESRNPDHPVEEDKLVDPILEARRRKFESNGSVPTEGIIRLSKKREEEEGNDEKSNEEEDIADVMEDEVLVDEILLTTKVDDIFSDDESDDENEGRFKSNSQKTHKHVPALPFTQLLKRSTAKATTDVKDKDKPRDKYKDRRRRPEVKDQKKPRSRSPRKSRSPLRNRDEKLNRADVDDKKNKSKNNKEPESDSKVAKIEEKKVIPKSRIIVKTDLIAERRSAPMTSPIENKKIEIKIRNPSKYEVERKYDVLNETEFEELEKKEMSNARRVEIAKKEEIESEIVIGIEEDDDIATKSEAGDLRAQLSRKRAERQNKLPLERVNSRLLQNALQGAVFKKPKKSKSKKKEKDAGLKDGKLPIHMRLGIAGNSPDLYPDGKSHKKSSRKRNKTRGAVEQV